MNLTNKHSRKNAGFLNDKAIGIQPDSNTVSHPTRTHPKSPVFSAHDFSFRST
jgi:large subunit ribosomal protein L28e